MQVTHILLWHKPCLNKIYYWTAYSRWQWGSTYCKSSANLQVPYTWLGSSYVVQQCPYSAFSKISAWCGVPMSSQNKRHHYSPQHQTGILTRTELSEPEYRILRSRSRQNFEVSSGCLLQSESLWILGEKVTWM